MATPKKKISKSRRNMRRFAAGNQLKKPTFVTSTINGELVRPHRVTIETLAQYVAEKKTRKASKAKQA